MNANTNWPRKPGHARQSGLARLIRTALRTFVRVAIIYRWSFEGFKNNYNQDRVSLFPVIIDC